MRSDLSNQVIARIDDEAQTLPRRTLDLGNIHTSELGLLSPRRTEIAPRGAGRDAALIAYSERLRNSYKTNEGGLRDGMLKLGEAFRDGQTITISCFCRAGEACHADVVKMAIEKVGNAMKVRGSQGQREAGLAREQAPAPHVNPRTQRAIIEILSVGRSEIILAKLEDTEGRNRSEHASHLNGHSQFVRDLYERGAVVRDGVLIFPKENSSLSPPLAITTNEYAVKKLSAILNETRARELAPQIVEYGTSIAGSYADRVSKIKVFNWIYGALEGRNEFLPTGERIPENQSKEEKVERTLKEIAGLADEMSRLEPSDKPVLIDDLSERSAAERSDKNDYDQSLEKIYEEAIVREPEPQSLDSQEIALGQHEFERIELGDTTLSRLASDMSKDELDRWIEVRLPALDEALENGTPANSILRVFQNNIYYAAKESPTDKQAAIDDLRFASAYIEHQLKQPESRLRHFNARYRSYAQMLERASSREEVIDAASRIRLENAKIGFQWEKLTDPEKVKTPPPLTSKEMRFLFTEASPRHYTSEMTTAKLSYMSVGNDSKTKTDSLMRGEISPSPEAAQLIDSLESRLGRRYLNDSVSATRHFLQSLKTPNDELRYKNAFDHSEIYRKLPAAERDFVYQRGILQKEQLEARLPVKDAQKREGAIHTASPDIDLQEQFSLFRQGVTSDIIDVLKSDPNIGRAYLIELTNAIVISGLKQTDTSNNKLDQEAIVRLGHDLAERISNHHPIKSKDPHHTTENQKQNGSFRISDQTLNEASPLRYR